ncbi:MAG: MFS transporter [Pseudomonadota bacterium]|jgi:MFS family permease
MATVPTPAPIDGAAPLSGGALAYLVFTLTMSHSMAAMAMMTLPAVAPLVASEYAVDASLVGYHISIVSLGLIISLVSVGNLSRRVGAARAAQIGHGLVAVGTVLTLLPWIGFLLPGALVIGIGFGLLAPAASALLVRFTPPQRRNLMFSIQQTSVPVGGMLSALVGPAIALHFGWRAAGLVALVMLGVAVVLLQLGRRGWDDDRDPRQPVLAARLLDGLADNWREPRLRLLSLTGLAFCWAQFCVATFTVVACVVALDLSLVTAGLVMMTVQLTNAAGRMVAGWVADRIGSAVRVMSAVAWVMFGTSVVFLSLGPNWSLPMVFGLFIVLGIASGAWAGILMADVGHHAPPGRVAAVVSGTLLYVNIGKLIGPAVFALLYALTHDYGIAFASLTGPALLAIACLRQVERGRTRDTPRP